mgnify:FL=1
MLSQILQRSNTIWGSIWPNWVFYRCNCKAFLATDLISFLCNNNSLVGSREDIGITFQFRWISRVQLHSEHILHFMNPILRKALRSDQRLIGLANPTWETTNFRQRIIFHYDTLGVATTQQLIAYSLQQSPCLFISLPCIFDLRLECKKVVWLII